MEDWLRKKYEGFVSRVVRVLKEDLKLPNHLAGHKRLYLQLCFKNISDLLAVRRDIIPLALENAKKRDAVDAYAEVVMISEAQLGMEMEGERGAWKDTIPFFAACSCAL